MVVLQISLSSYFVLKVLVSFLFPGKTHKHQTLFRFYFRGCGWKAKDVFWDHGEILWLKVMDQLMTMMFGADFLSYEYDRKRNCHVQDEDLPQFVYDMEEWVSTYSNMINENETVKGDISSPLQL